VSNLYRISTIRIVFWSLAFLLGAAQTWEFRHVSFSDGISYMDIADAYMRGDWHNAINPYWSPLYSWAIAVADVILRPAPYWQVATLHFVNFLAFIAAFLAFEFFTYELLLLRRDRQDVQSHLLSDGVVYFAGCSALLIAGLSLVNIWFCSPDMISMALVITITALIVRIERTGGSNLTFVFFGLACAALFLARSAFALPFVICLLIVLAIRHVKRLALSAPAWIILGSVIILVTPFVVAISIQEGKFTIGEAGKLNYGWEISGAPRFAHWQGEPYDIGKPKHPTKLVLAFPKTYTFDKPIAGTYPPWYNPAYWYDGIEPKLKIRPQLLALTVNLSVLANLFVRSPIVISVFLALLWTSVPGWGRNLVNLWPILIPSLTIIGLYCIVYIDRRYIAGNLVILWMAILVSIQPLSRTSRRRTERLIVVLCFAYLAIFVVRRQRAGLVSAFKDLSHRREQVPNINFLLAERLKTLGVHAGDAVAYIGPAVDAEWARLDRARIVAEIPLVYERNQRLFDSGFINQSDDVRKFWTADAATREQVLQAFRNAGAKIVVTDGRYEGKLASQWSRVLPQDQPGLPQFDDDPHSQLNSRYLILDSKR
jgi:hypothetical protein